MNEINQHLARQVKSLQIGQETQMVRMIDVMNNDRQDEKERTLAIDDRRKIT